jgi:hypothetical protein
MDDGTGPVALPFEVENDTEARMRADPDWIAGAEWGDPRPGHPEGAAKFHVAEVLANVDRYAVNPEDRRRLRIAAITHDTFKNQVDETKPRVGENHHGMLARRFAERYVDDTALLDIIELHDEAYNAYSTGVRREAWAEADARAAKLLERLGVGRELYLTFFRCDDETGTKDHDALDWFARKVAEAERRSPSD